MKTHKPKKVHPAGKARPTVQSPAAVKTYQPKLIKNWREFEKQWEKENPGMEMDPDPDDDPDFPTPEHVKIVLGFDPQEEADLEANTAKGKAKRKREIDGGLRCPACGTKWTLHDVNAKNLTLGDKCPECDKAAPVPLRNTAAATGKDAPPAPAAAGISVPLRRQK